MSTVCVTRTPEFSDDKNARVDAQLAPAMGFANSPVAQHLYRVLSRCWAALLLVLTSQRPGKKYLRVCESVSLGDKRFVAVIQAGDERFLVAGAANSIAMLTRLSEPSPTFSAALKDCADVGPELQ